MCVPLELTLVALWAAVGCGLRRRSHFWARLMLACLGIPSLLAALVVVVSLSDGSSKLLIPLLLVCGVAPLMLAPGLLYGTPDPLPGASGHDEDGGGGPGWGRPPSEPSPPRGGIPSRDADRSGPRARDHNRPALDVPMRRRPAHGGARTSLSSGG